MTDRIIRYEGHNAPRARASEHVEAQPDDGWRTEAACSTVDPEMWFPDHGGAFKEPLRICREECPVRLECLAFALRANEAFGIYGGTTERARRPYLTLVRRGVSPIDAATVAIYGKAVARWAS